MRIPPLPPHKPPPTTPTTTPSPPQPNPPQEAENCERSSPPQLVTARAIVRCVAGLGVDPVDLEATLVADAEEAAKRGAVETARALYAQALATFPSQAQIWRAAAALEKAHGSRAALDELLKRAVTFCPQVGGGRGAGGFWREGGG